MEATVAIGALIVGFGAVFAAYQGWRAVVKNPRLRGRPLAEIRQMSTSVAGRVALVLMFVALVVGLVGGWWFSARLQEGKERDLEQPVKR